MAFLNKLLKGAGIVLIGTATGKLMSYFYLLLVANKLGSYYYGLLSLGFAVVEFLAAIALLGLYDGLVRYVSYYNASKDYEKVKGAIISAVRIFLPASIIFAVLMFLLSDTIAVQLFHKKEILPLIIKILAIALPLLCLENILLGIMRGFQRVDYEMLGKELIGKSLKFLFAFAAIFIFGFGLIGVVWSFFFSAVLLSVILFLITYKLVKPYWKANAVEYKKELLIFSIPLMLMSIMVFLLGWTDIFMLGILKTSQEVGIYNVAMPIARLILVIPIAVVALLVPIISGLYSKKKSEDVKSVFMNASKWNLLLNMPILLFLILFSREILSLMFKAEYGFGLPVIWILAAGFFLNSLFYPCSSVLISIKRTKEIFLAVSIFGLLNVLLNYILIPNYGIFGAAIATSISFIIGGLIIGFFCHKHTKLYLLKSKDMAKIFLAGAVTYAFFAAAKSLIKINNLIILLIAIGLCGLVYIGLLFGLKLFDEEDKKFFNAVKNKLIPN